MSDSDSNRHAPSNGSPVDGFISIRGARVHNLRNVDLDIPRNQLVVITGLSGSGKSSLAFDTVYAEGQRQYIESLSVYARQFLNQMERPDVDLIEGLQPTISIDQRAGSHNPRSTVATVTEIYDYLRLMMARLGTPHCYGCGQPIRQQSPEQILDDLLTLPPKTKAMILSPFVRGRKGEHKEVFEAIRKCGFVRTRVDGVLYDLDGVPSLTRQKKHQIEAVVDRVILREEIRPRIADSINLALKHGEGVVVVSQLLGDDPSAPDAQWHDTLYSSLLACPECKISYDELEPRSFSFNSPYGACPTCEGLGVREEFDPELVVPDPALSLADGAVAPWRGATPTALKKRLQQLKAFFTASGASRKTPLTDLKPKDWDLLWRGNGGFLGLATLLEQQYTTCLDAAEMQQLATFRSQQICADCQGSRLRPEARFVRLAGLTLPEINRMSLAEAQRWFDTLEFHGDQALIAQAPLTQIRSRLKFLNQVGVDYLTLDRSADTLSGGESQRVRLATGVGSGLVGVCYVLDEPSIGLHQRDNDRLIHTLRELQQQGNSVLVVEHDAAIMRHADHLIDLGPGPGRRGGSIVAQGRPDELIAAHASLTARYLSGDLQIVVPKQRRKAVQKHSIVIEGARTNNLKDVTAKFPLSVLIAVTGVSGSGKSSLLNETLARAISRKLYGSGPKPGPHTSLRGLKQIDKFVQIDQSAIGRTPRSNPATYTGLFDEIRKVFANTREAKLHGFAAGRFSFNVKGGRCEECQGQGVQKIEMNFLPDLYVNCPTCEGARFNRQTLEIRYRDKSIADVLDMTVDEALEFFANFPVIHRLLTALDEVGLGYMTLGQSSVTMSGGEAQRIKLATELSRVDTGKTLYLLDEPTTGLHFDDIQKLLKVLERLVHLGNTVIVIEHNLDVVKSADWIIDLGPEGGEKGGQIVATGTPEQIAALDDNHTGRYLREILSVERNGHTSGAVEPDDATPEAERESDS